MARSFRNDMHCCAASAACAEAASSCSRAIIIAPDAAISAASVLLRLCVLCLGGLLIRAIPARC